MFANSGKHTLCLANKHRRGRVGHKDRGVRMPPPGFRSTVPNELGRPQVARWSVPARVAAWIANGVAVLAVLLAFLLGPLATLAVLAVCGLFLAAMIYVPRRLRFTRAGIIWT